MSATLDLRVVCEQLTNEGPHPEPEAIGFHTFHPGFVAGEFTIRNRGTQRSELTFGCVKAAALGAFVPWQELDILTVPALAPGASVVIARAYLARRPRVLAGAAKMPPDHFLKALGIGGDDEPRREIGELPADPLAILGRGSIHWAGNLKLFLPTRDVEHHMAQALRVYPGRQNIAMFVVGSDKADEYQFWLTGDGIAWDPWVCEQLHPLVSFSPSQRGDAVSEGEWCRPAGRLFNLIMVPPRHAGAARINVWVRQRSTDRVAVVRFSLDSRVTAAGCYVI